MLKISKLIPEETVLCHIAGGRVREIANRNTGFTLGCALSLIGEALKYPCKCQSRMANSLDDVQAMVDMTNQVIKSTSLKYLAVEVVEKRIFVVYQPFYTPSEWVVLKEKAKNK